MGLIEFITRPWRQKAAEIANPALGIESASLQWGGARDRAVGGSVATMLDAYKSWVYACAQMNATTAASIPLRLYYMKSGNTRRLNVPTRKVSRVVRQELSSRRSLMAVMRKGMPENLEEITEHPVLTMLENVNGLQDGYESMVNTWTYLELCGNG